MKKKKIGGLLVVPQEYEDFAFCLNSCELHEMPFKGSPFTWWNGRAANDCIFKRLDRVVHNHSFQNWFRHLEVEHLSRTGSDHAPLLLSCGDQVENFIKPFRFFKFLVEHDTFLDFIKQQWEADLSDDVFLSFKLKMKKLKVALSKWSQVTFGDIFKQLVIREDIVKIKEQLIEENPSKENRMVMQKAQAELKLLVKGRRKRIQIKRIQDADGTWLEDADRVVGEAVKFFHKQFTHEEVSKDSPILNHIPELIREEDNMLLAEQPTMEEVQKAVFELNRDSTCGPHGFSRIFYQKCWEVIKADVFSVVKAFFDGQTLPKSITHTNLVLLPKKNIVESFSGMRPIILSNFINKVISRVVHDRLDRLLTRVISPNQLGFVKGRNIIENAHGFFHSTRGVKPGDPLSPAVFIIAAEVLSIALNSLFDQPGFVVYGMPKWSAKLNHLAYADDTSIFPAVEAETGFVRGKFPCTYLGVPITHARKRKVDYTELSKKVKDKLQTWKGKLLSYGGKAVLITSVLQRGLGFRSIYEMSKAYVLNFGGSLEPLVHFGLISCGTNTVRSKFLRWFNGKEAHKYGR
ncbi:uncharacterized protein LOC132042545 [Lycium ferocissimum]|uniref:uncharacterized protein LOC132042545 n=1 Tax=Lycium ferocissimum TaxID=112874 RepID=UPI002814AB59|nr:uncharacterized protein LOC132042545 [Lycium ferocissimum]